MIPEHPPKVSLRTGSSGHSASNLSSAFIKRVKTINQTVTTNAVNNDIDTRLDATIT